MAKMLVGFCLGIVIFSFFSSPVMAACKPPSDYSSCATSPFGTNGVQLMDSQYKPIETDFSNLRQIADQSGSAGKRIQATIILTDGTIGDRERTLEIFKNAEKYGIDMTIRTWGNDMDLPVASKMGADLSYEVAAFKQQYGKDIRVELGNEPNLDTSGSKYAQEFAEFAKTCSSCQLYLPSLGGPDAVNKENFLKSFFSNSSAVAAATKAEGIVFNSYADTPRGAVTDWVNTLAQWQEAAGGRLNFDRMKFFLTETGPPNGDINWPNLDDFLTGIANEYMAIKSDPTSELGKLFAKLEGLTYFIWTKDEKLILVYVDKDGKVIKRQAGKGNNLPGKIPLGDPFKNKKSNCFTPVSFGAPDESKWMCPGECGYSAGDGVVPQYHKSDGKIEPELPNGVAAGLVFGSPVQGMACGQSRSDSIVLQEYAPYDLFNPVDVCEKKHNWVGEIMYTNMNVPFAQAIGEHWAGKLDIEHYPASEIKQIRKLASQYYSLHAQEQTQIESARIPQFDFAKMVTIELGEVKAGEPTGFGSYGLMPIEGKPFAGSPADDAQLNPQQGIRDWSETKEAQGLIECGYPEGEPPDDQAPQLGTILGTDPTKDFTKSYKVNDSNWAVSFQCMKGETDQVAAPETGHHIGGGYDYLVLYADEHFVTLANFRADEQNDPSQGPVLPGYTVHLSNVNVDPKLVGAYRQANANGRSTLPAVTGGDVIGKATEGEVCVSVRDSDDFMDPRSKLDWWQDYADAPNAGLCKGGSGGRGKGKMTPEQARRKMFEESGVLGKLLPGETQDELKADFVRYVQYRVNNGLSTMYAGFQIDGQSIMGMSVPMKKPTQSQLKDNPELMTAYRKSISTWANTYRETLGLMPLFPNDAPKGVVKVDLCGDREYADSSMTKGYPEVMKLGLASNQLYQLLQSQDAQDTFYKDNVSLRRPLEALDGKHITDADDGSTRVAVIDEAENSIGSDGQQNLTVAPKDDGFWGKFRRLISRIIPGIGSALAVGDNQLLAQAGGRCFNLSSSIYPVNNPDGSVDVHYSLYLTGLTTLGTHVQLYAGIPGQKAGDPYNNGLPGLATNMAKILEPGKVFIFNSSDLGGPIHLSPEQAKSKVGFSAKLDECNEMGNQDYSYCDPITKLCDKEVPPVAPGESGLNECDSKTACCITKSCTPRSFANVRFGPPFTRIPASDAEGDVFLGMDFGPNGTGPAGTQYNPVNLTFKKDEWTRYSDKANLPGDCRYISNTSQGDSCSKNSDCPGWGSEGGLGCRAGTCAPFSCVRTHEREAAIYHIVPYLWSLWEQSAGGCVKECVAKGKVEAGCQATCGITGNQTPSVGFLNLLKPDLPAGIVSRLPAPSYNVNGCSSALNDVFEYNSTTGLYGFKGTPAATKLAYLFHIGLAGLTTGKNPNAKQQGVEGWPELDGISDVVMTTPAQQNLLFYRLAGVCNANKWFSEKVLNPTQLKKN